jgi:glucose-6-phosphate-specific signal transduction histidine kinase
LWMLRPGWNALRPTRIPDPWFVDRPRLAAVLAAALFGAVFVLRLTNRDSGDAVSLLLTLPIALLATSFGLRGGLVGGLGATVLLVVWVFASRVDLSPLGWASRLAPLLLLGYLLGDAVDRLRRAETARLRLEEDARRHRDAVQLNDSIVQSLSAAKWALEAGDLDGGLQIVTETLHLGNQLVSDLIRNTDLRPLWMGGAQTEP